MATTPNDPAFARKEDRSLAALFGDLTSELSALVRQEIALARAEISEKIGQIGAGIFSLAAGGMLILIGLFFIVQALVFGVAAILTNWVSGETAAWLAPLLVGLLVVVIGWVLLSKGRSNLAAENLTPRRTAESLQRDGEFAREQADRLRHDAAAGAGARRETTP
ncbi:MAG TPA: phage holin family protein [Geminicoccaceae bacterium]|nr:phage holin family protein [Geminicoccaceae bacterium]